MKHRLVLLLIMVPTLAIMGFAIRSGQLARYWQLLVQSSPIIDCPSTVRLGACERGEIAVARFAMANRGGSPLLIDQIRTNCSCSGLEQEVEGRFVRINSLTIDPGKQIQVVVRLSVNGSAGSSLHNRIMFRTNDYLAPQAHVDVIVPEVTAGVTASPSTVVLGSVGVGSQARQVVVIRDDSSSPRVLEKVVSSDPSRVKVDILNIDKYQERTQEGCTVIGHIEVSVDTSQPGRLDEVIRIYLLGQSRVPDSVRIVGRVVDKVESLPASLVLPRASSSGPIYEGSCICQSTDGMPLDLRVDIAPPQLVVRIEAIEGVVTSKLVRIQFLPDMLGESPGQVGYVVKLLARVGEGEQRILEIPVTCQGKERP